MKKPVTMRLEERLAEALKAEAEASSATATAIAEEALRKHLADRCGWEGLRGSLVGESGEVAPSTDQKIEELRLAHERMIEDLDSRVARLEELAGG